MSLKGFPTQKKDIAKLDGYTDKQSQTTSEFVTVQPTFSDRNALDTVALTAFRIHPTVKTATPDAKNPKRVFSSTAHGAKEKDIIRFETSANNPGFESSILSVPDANTIILGAETPQNILGTDTFYILRYVTSRVDDSGALIVSTANAPIQYVYNGTDTEVSQDTSTPANSRPLPVVNLNTSGVATNPATSDLQQAEAVLIGAVNETAPANDTANSGLNGRLQRIAQRITSLIALLPASLGTKAAAASLATTWSTEDEALVGSLTETAPGTDTASSGLNGRLQRIAQRLTSFIGLFPSSIGQKNMAGSLSVVVASDQSTVNVQAQTSANIIGKVGIDQTTPGTTNLVAANNTQINGTAILAGNGATGAGSQRVTIASDNTPIPSISSPSSSSTNAASSSDSTALESNRVIKASAGRLFTLSGINTSTSAQYIQVFNSATVPANGATPILLAYVPSGGTFSWSFYDIGKYFSTGISVSNSSTASTKTIGSADCWFNAEYL